VPVGSLRGLAGFDYRQSLIADGIIHGTGAFACAEVLGSSGLQIVTEEAFFRGLESDYFKDFNPEAFLRVHSSIRPLKTSLTSSSVAGQEA
jgi:hypothetical protein